MQVHHRLAISIPTYRRPDHLRKCLESVLTAAGPHQVQIFVADDSANEVNQPLLNEFQERSPLIHVHTNPGNLGIDRNIQQAVDIAKADYVWLLGEDDRIRPHAVSHMLHRLENTDAPFVYANYSAVDNDFEFIIKERSLPITSDDSCDATAFYRDLSWSMGFIGACVIQKAAWDATDPEIYQDTYFNHVGRIMQAIHGHQVPMVAEPLVLNRCGSPDAFSWTGDARNVFSGWERMTKKLLPFYPEADAQASLDHFKKAHGIGSLKFLAYLRADGVLHAGNVGDMTDPKNNGAAHRFAAKLIAVLPRWPWRVVRSMLMWNRQRRSPALDL